MKGYPGNLVASVEYSLDQEGGLHIKMKVRKGFKEVMKSFAADIIRICFFVCVQHLSNSPFLTFTH